MNSLGGVTVAAGQKVVMMMYSTLGSSAATTGGGTNLNIYPAYQSSTGTIPLNVGGGTFGLTVPAGQRHTFPMFYTFTGLAAGTYTFGIAGSSNGTAASWNNNGWGYGSILVTN